MVNPSKNKGTAGETAIVNVGKPNGFPNARRIALAGALDQGDVELCPGVIVEVKAGKVAENASPALIAAWLDETAWERVNAGASVGILIVKRKGVSGKRALKWRAYVHASQLNCLAWQAIPAGLALTPIGVSVADCFAWLRFCGWGEPLPAAFTQGEATL